MPDPSIHERLAGLSRFFLGLDLSELERGIREKLPESAALAGAQRTRLIVVGRQRPVQQYEWCAPGYEASVQRIASAAERGRLYRFAAAILEQRQVFHVPDVAALPDAAEPERSHTLARGVKAILTIPVCQGDSVIGFQSFDRVDEARGWSDDEISALQLVGEIFACALERKRAQDDLASQRLAERRVAELSRRLLGARADEIDRAIDECLPEAAELAGADRAFLYSFGLDGRPGLTRYDWCGEGAVPGTTEALPWGTRTVLRDGLVHVPRVEDLPPEAAAERAELEGRGVRSLLGLAVRSGDVLTGFVGFECVRRARRWSEWEITLLQLVGELFTGALRRRRVEDTLRERELQLFQSQKIEALGRLAGGIAHDFNNLLSVILGFSGPALAELAEGDPFREDLAMIQAAAEKAAGLTRRLLEFSRRQPAEPLGRADLAEVVDGMLGLLRGLLGEDVELVVELDRSLAPVRADAGQLEQVLVNLAVNARDAMPDGGVLHIETAREELSRTAAERLRLPRAGSWAVLRVSDSGHGLDDDVRARIFDPFFTTKEPGKGSGLGLSIVYSIVEQAGGAIGVTGAPGKGTAFSIYLC